MYPGSAKRAKFLTYDGVIAECLSYMLEVNLDSPAWWVDHQGTMVGFNYVYQYVELENGWVGNPYMVNEYGLFRLVSKYGTLNDRLKFNANIDIHNEDEAKRIAQSATVEPDIEPVPKTWIARREMVQYLKKSRPNHHRPYHRRLKIRKRYMLKQQSLSYYGLMRVCNASLKRTASKLKKRLRYLAK